MAAMSSSAGLEHIGGVSNPVLGVQAHFLEVATSTVCDKGWVVVRAEKRVHCRSWEPQVQTHRSKRPFGDLREPEFNMAGPWSRAGKQWRDKCRQVNKIFAVEFA